MCRSKMPQECVSWCCDVFCFAWKRSPKGADYINVGADFLIRFYFLTCLHFPAFHSFILSLKMQEQS